MADFAVRPCEPNPAATSLDVLVRLAAVHLGNLGANWRAMASRHELNLDGEAAEGQRIPTRLEHAFLDEAALASRDGLFSWRLGDLRLQDFGLIGYAVLNAPTVAEALVILAALVPGACEAVGYQTVEDGNMTTLVETCSDDRPNSVFGLRFMLNVLRDLIGPGFRPLRAGLALADAEHLERLAPHVASPLCADFSFAFVTFPSRHLRASVMGADARLAETLRPYWQRQAAAFDRATTVQQSRLAGAVLQNLHRGVPTVDQMAETLKLGRARLLAQLAPAGGYRAFVDDVRRRLAEETVRRTTLPLALIADRLGFSEPASFSHAYRRWTGCAPGVHRCGTTARSSTEAPERLR